MKGNIGGILKYVLSVLVAVVLVFFAFRGTDWKVFFDGLVGTNWWFICLSVSAALAALFFREERWRIQLLPLDSGISRFSVWHGSNVGNLLNVVIPGVGEFTRCGYVSTKKAPYDKVFGTILMERAWDVLAIAVLLVLAALTNTDVIIPFMKEHVFEPFAGRFDFSLWWIAALLVILAAAALWAVFRFSAENAFCAKIAGWLRGMTEGFSSFAGMDRKALFLLYSAAIWMMYILMTWLTFQAVPGLDHLGFADAVFISAVGNIASVIPTPGNIGPYHYLVGMAISTIYLQADAMTALGLLCATLSHGTHAILIILLGLESYFRISFKKKVS